jgi:hypothetical protein
MNDVYGCAGHGVGDEHPRSGREVTEILRAHGTYELEVDALEDLWCQAGAGGDGDRIVLGVRGIAAGEDDDVRPLCRERRGRPARECLATHYQGGRCSEL